MSTIRPGLPQRGSAVFSPGQAMAQAGVDVMDPQGRERLWYPLFFQTQISSSTSTAVYFNSVPSTRRAGNILEANTLPDPQLMEVWGIGFLLDPRATTADAQLILASGMLRLTINQKPYFDSPLLLLPGGGGVAGYSTGTDVDAPSNGLPSPQASHWFPLPLVIKPRQNYQVDVDFSGVSLSTLSASTDSWVILYGILHRYPLGM